MNYLAANLKYLRKGDKSSQQKVADDLQIERSTYCRYEYGVSPKITTIQKIARYYGLSMSSLMLLDLEKERITSTLKK